MNNLRGYTIADLSKRLSLSRSKIYEEIKAKRLVVRKVGRRTIVLDQDARAWLENDDGKQAA
jgi:excisionase family DNA binding protein